MKLCRSFTTAVLLAALCSSLTQAQTSNSDMPSDMPSAPLDGGIAVAVALPQILDVEWAVLHQSDGGMSFVDGGAWSNDAQLDVTSKLIVRTQAENESLRSNAGSKEAEHLTIIGIACFLIGAIAGGIAVAKISH